jgi:hypothetical protein
MVSNTMGLLRVDLIDYEDGNGQENLVGPAHESYPAARGCGSGWSEAQSEKDEPILIVVLEGLSERE